MDLRRSVLFVAVSLLILPSRIWAVSCGQVPGPPAGGGPGNDFIFFSGTAQALMTSFTNPYSSEVVMVNLAAATLNDASYDGAGGTDTLLMTILDDVICLFDEDPELAISSVETFIAGDGNDVILLADAAPYGDTTIFGGDGADILWTNSGSDSVTGGAGNDIIDGGPGGDTLFGNDDNDSLSGGAGNDELDGGDGNDMLQGGPGADVYAFDTFVGSDTIIELPAADLNTIEPPVGVTLDDLSFIQSLAGLTVDVAALGSISIPNQYDADTSGIDSIEFSDMSILDLKSTFLTCLDVSDGATPDGCVDLSLQLSPAATMCSINLDIAGSNNVDTATAISLFDTDCVGSSSCVWRFCATGVPANLTVLGVNVDGPNAGVCNVAGTDRIPAHRTCGEFTELNSTLPVDLSSFAVE